MRYFTSLNLNNWRQFDLLELDLSRKFTILTGQNGCGKTTILNILNRHFGWSISFVSTPYMSKRRARRIWSDIYNPSLYYGPESYLDSLQDTLVPIGHITYSTGEKCILKLNTIVSSAQYQPSYEGMQNVIGLHIPSHRPVATYTHIANIPTDPKTATQDYQAYQQLLNQYYGGSRVDNPGKIQKQSLMSFAVFGEGNSSVRPNAESKATFDDFQVVLRKVLPKSLGFRRIEIRMPEVVLVTDSGDFSLDAMSGGISAIFSIAWQIHMFSRENPIFTVTIDEPENHLHPSMQRTLLPNLSNAFPDVRFVISTHSPFIVSSFPEANIYALVRNERQRIVAGKLDLSDVSGTPNEVLREILDVDSNLPVWVEESINQVMAESASLEVSERARIVMEKLKELGIADAIVEYQRGRKSEKNH